VLEEVPVPKVGVNDVLIETLRTAICGTDVHIYNWDAWAQKTIPVPMVVGHEVVGRVVEMGANVAGFKTGDIVSCEGHIVCGHCRNCLAGRRHLCKDTLGVGVNRPGAFGEYVSVPASNSGTTLPRSRVTCRRSSTPLATPSIPALQFRCSARTCSSLAPVPSVALRRRWLSIAAPGTWS